MTAPAAACIALYVLGAAQTLPALRGLLRDQAARVYYPTWAIAAAGVVILLVWPLMVPFGVVRLARNWKQPSRTPGGPA